MTGFGKSITSLSDKHISVEIKSLNSKSIDINTRIPQAYREKELDFRKLIAEQLLRGKVDFTIYVENIGTQTPAKINENIVKSYIEQMRSIVDGDLTELLKMAVRMPDALQGTCLYEPCDNPKENALKAYLKTLWGDRYGY